MLVVDEAELNNDVMYDIQHKCTKDPKVTSSTDFKLYRFV